MIRLILMATSCGWLIAALMIVLGLRGRRVGDHRHCRRCGYDVFGITSGICPECGSDLSRKKSTVIGMRQRRRHMLSTGTCLLMVMSVGVGFGINEAAKGINWQEYKPVWLLRSEAKDVKTHAAALAELQRRLEEFHLSQTQIDSVADATIIAQADMSVPWDQDWGDFVELARDQKKLSNERWQRYILGAIEHAIQCDVRPHAHAADLLPLQTSLIGLRLGHSPPQFDVNANVTISGDALQSQPHNDFRQYDVRWYLNRYSGNPTLHFASIDRAKAAPGPQVVHVVLDTDVWDSHQSRFDTPPLFSKRFELDRSWALLRPGEPSVELVNDAKFHEETSSDIHVKLLTYDGTKCDVLFAADSLPIPVCFDVSIRAGDQHWELSPIILTDRLETCASHGTITGMKATRVDVLLKPNPAPPCKTVEITRIYGGQITLSNVGVFSTEILNRGNRKE